MLKRGFSWTLLKGIFYAIVINAAQLHAYWTSNGDSPRVLQDAIDESLYLRIALDQGRFMPQEAIYFEHATPLPLAQLLTHWRPDQTYSHFIVGWIATQIGLNVQELNLVLDIMCGVGGYLTFYLLFSLILGESRLRLAELSAISFLCLPWLSSLENLIETHSLFPSLTAQIGPVCNSALPIQEGVESQLSTIWFGLTLVAFVHCARDNFKRRKLVLLLGLMSGLSIYFYVLQWVASTILFACFISVAALLLRRKTPGQQMFGALTLFGLSDFCAALPGLIQIKVIRETKHIFIDDPTIYRLGYYAPAEWLIILLSGAIILVAARHRLSPLAMSLHAAILATIAAELCILNLQPLVGVATVGIFIAVCFTRPVLSSLLVTSFFLPFSNRKLYRLFFGALTALFVVSAGYRNYRLSTESPQNEEALTPLITFVRQHIPKKSVMAMLTYNHPFENSTREWDWRWEPNTLAAFTDTHLLKEALGLEWGALSPLETISRELALGAVFTGTPKLLRGCAEEILLTPTRMFFQQWIPIQLTRQYNCHQARSIIQGMTTCDAFKNYRIDYIVWEQEFNLPKPDYLNRSARRIWSSPRGDVEVLELNRERVLDELCRSQQVVTEHAP